MMTTPSTETTGQSELDERRKSRAEARAILAAVFGLITLGIGIAFCVVDIFPSQNIAAGFILILFGMPLAFLTGLLAVGLGISYLASSFKGVLGNVSALIGLLSPLLVIVLIVGATASNDAQQAAKVKADHVVTKHTVTIEVTGTVKADGYYNLRSEGKYAQAEPLTQQSLPWRVSGTVKTTKLYPGILSDVDMRQRWSGPGSPVGTLSCKVIVDGKVVSQQTSTASPAHVACYSYGVSTVAPGPDDDKYEY